MEFSTLLGGHRWETCYHISFPRSGSTFFHYKKSFTIVLLAVCSTNYELSIVDIGAAGCQTDGGICNNSKLGMAIDRNLLNIPEPATINEYSATKKISISSCCR